MTNDHLVLRAQILTEKQLVVLLAAMLQHPCPKRVYIAGGGEMATAREVRTVYAFISVESRSCNPKLFAAMQYDVSYLLPN